MDIRITQIPPQKITQTYINEVGSKIKVNPFFLHKENCLPLFFRWQTGNLFGFIGFAIPLELTISEPDEFNTFLEDNKDSPKTISDLYKKYTERFTKEIATIFFKHPSFASSLLKFNFDDKLSKKKNITIMSGMGGNLIDCSPIWLDWMFQRKTKHDQHKIADYFARTVLHEKQHIHDTGIGNSTTFEGIARLKEYIFGHHLFNPWKNDLNVMYEILEGSLPNHKHSSCYITGLYVWLILIIDYLSRNSNEDHFKNFKSLTLKNKFKIMKLLPKLINQSQQKEDLFQKIHFFFNDVNEAELHHSKIISLFRSLEEKMNLPTLPTEYLEDFSN